MMRKYYILFVLFACLLGSACEDALRMIPENSVTFENSFENEREVEIGVLSVERYVRKNIGMTDVQSPAINGEYTDYHTARSGLREDMPAEYMKVWRQLYDVIAMANVPLPYIDRVEMRQERRDFYKGRIYFAKALAYFELGRRWGACPIIRDEVEIKPVAFSSWVEVIDYAIELTRKALKLLPEYPDLKDSDGNANTYKSTPCKGAANALLAHLCAWKAGCKYMARPDEATYDERALWMVADSACTAIIERDDIYSLAVSPEEVCTSVLVGNSRESIYENVIRGFWEELENEDAAVPSYPFTFGRIYQTWPIIPGEGAGKITSKGWRILNSTVRKMFPTRIEGGKEVTDLRRDAYFYKLDSMSHDTLLGITNGYAYPQKWRSVLTYTSGYQTGRFLNFDQNRIWFRLADIILLRAECRARLGNQGGAIADLNRIRERANAEFYKASEYDGDLRYAIYKEREKELLMEGWRWYDVIRNEYYKTEFFGGFEKVSPQDILDGVFFNGVSVVEFSNNPLARQNTYWLKRM